MKRNFEKCDLPSEPLPNLFLICKKVASSRADHNSKIKKWRSPSSFSSDKYLKPKELKS